MSNVYTQHVLIWRNKEIAAKVIKLFSCSSQLSMELIVVINVKMLTIVGILIVGILTLTNMINTTYGSFNE